MLAQRNRLRKASEFAIATKGKKVAGENFLLYITSPESSEASRAPVKVGLIVAKNVGNSVTRHRISRQIRHAISPLLKNFSGGYILVRALPSSRLRVGENIAMEISALVESALSVRK